MGTDKKKTEAIFDEAIQFKDITERDAYVLRACGDDQKLLARIRALLEHHDASSFLDSPIFESDITLDESPLTEGPGTVIGRYKLLEKIGEGGMAVVYMAEQQEPISRKVALKIIKLGMDTKSVIARFEAERQALAMMDHPNIAKVLDASATETGRPYFVMDLVPGLSVTEYCDKNRLSIKERLKLFITVCDAVQHAHQKGIIHRDIKPSNIMVTMQNGKAVPKVIDFGISKATNKRLTEKTLFTRYAHIIGTPAYMSPEQAELSDLDVDTRTDIYSLGVLLYELLTGTTPFSEEKLREAGYLQMQKIICEEEPTKPSTKLSTLGKALTDIAKWHSSSPESLPKLVRGDLDWIVLKSLEKDRERRYDTVSFLASDIQRHLDDQPVLARAPGTLYLLHKFLRRHGRRTAAVLAIILLLGTVIMISLLLNQERKRSAATEASTHQDILTHAATLLENNDLTGAIERLETIVDSRYVGAEASSLRNRIISDIREQVRSCTEKIERDLEDAESYLRRAQLSHCLSERDAVLADMERYLSVLYPMSKEDSSGRRLKDFLVRLWRSSPANLGSNINTSFDEWSPYISNDGLSLLFDSNRASNFQSHDLWIAKRPTISDAWNTATPLGPPVDGPPLANGPAMSADGLSLYFAWRHASWDLCVSTRKTTYDNWGAPVDLGPTVNTWAQDSRPSVSADGLSLFFTTNRLGSFGDDDIYVSTRKTTDQPWGEPVNLGSTVNSPFADGYAKISADGHLLFFTSFRPGGSGSADIWVTTRATKIDNWGPPVNLGPTVNSPYQEASCCISADNSTLYFSSKRPGGHGRIDLWQVSIGSLPGVNQQEDYVDSMQIVDERNDGKEVMP